LLRAHNDQMKQSSDHQHREERRHERCFLTDKAHANIVESPHERSNQTQRKRAHLSGRIKGIMKTRHAIKKKMLPNIAQKLPMLAMQNPIAEITNKTQPTKLI
jgi:hypothetical protein